MLSNILYILPMLLGRTFDARYDRVGIDIFPQSEIDQARILPEQETSSRYQTTASEDDLRDLLDVSADLALKVKAGKVDFKGTGTYLRDTQKVGKTVEILTRMKFTTYTVALSANAKPFPTWIHRNKHDLGTHYVRSVSYGGELLASIRFKANKETDMNTIQAEIKNNFIGGNATGLVADGKLESVQSRLKDKASMEISYYATVPLKNVPNTIDGLRSLVKGFDQHVKEVNNGWGVPIRVELVELSRLHNANDSFDFLKNTALEAKLRELEYEFDDLREAYSMMTDWYRSLPTSINPQQEGEINSLYNRVLKVLRLYYDSIGKLNIEEGPDSQIGPAQEAYKEGKFSVLPGKFSKEFRRLKKKIIVHEKKMYGTGTGTYIRWGTKSCPETPMIYQLSTGFMSATTNRGTGGGSDYLCLPDEPEFKDQDPSFGSDSSTHVAGTKYGLMDEHPFEEHDVRSYFGRGVPCSTCHLTNRTLIHVFPAADECPEDWITEYSGYLMSGSNLPGTHICMDEKPESYEQNTEEQQSHTLSIVHVSEIEGGLPKPPYRGKAAVQCIVCSK
uniref:Uncharacterized protein n=1 Tax=Parasteatoda tepidariorum TaxID=114398 RepID=A0A2L2XXL2_PARTP